MEQYQIVARRFRPQTFEDVVGQDPIVTTLKNGLATKRIPQAYLFTGSRGTGKTTLARLMAKALNCASLSPECEPCTTCTSCKEIALGHSLNVIEIDGASNRGVDDIRQINETVHFAPKGDLYKIFIIDEVHMLTREAFNALLKTLEEPPPNVKFFFATTEPHKILSTIISRCQRFDLKRIPLPTITAKLKRIAKELSVEIADEALTLIAQAAEGGLRDAESLFDQMLCSSKSPIGARDVQRALGIPNEELFQSLDQAILSGNLEMAITLADTLFQEGQDLSHFLHALLEHLHSLLLIQIAPKQAQKRISETAWKWAEAASPLLPKETLFYMIDEVFEAIQQLSKSSFKRIHLEMLLLRLIRSKQVSTIGALTERLEHLISGNPLPSQPPLPTPPEKKVELAPPPAVQKVKTSSKNPKPSAASPSGVKKKSDYDTLIRFAAVELEGSVQRT